MALSIALARLLARRDEAAAATRARNVELRSCLAALRKEPLSRNDEDVGLIHDFVCNNLADGRDSIFKDMPRAVLFEVCRFMQYQEVLPGTVLFRQGEVGNSMYYIVLRGVCSVFVRSKTEQLRVEAEFERRSNQGLGDVLPKEHLGKRVKTCVAGEAFGEEALANDDILLSQRTCTAVAGRCPGGVVYRSRDPSLYMEPVAGVVGSVAAGVGTRGRSKRRRFGSPDDTALYGGGEERGSESPDSGSGSGKRAGVKPVQVLCLHRTAYTKLLQGDDSGMLAAKVRFLSQLHMFANWPQRLVTHVALTMQVQRVPQHQYLYRTGDQAGSLYIVKSGALLETQTVEYSTTMTPGAAADTVSAVHRRLRLGLGTTKPYYASQRTTASQRVRQAAVASAARKRWLVQSTSSGGVGNDSPRSRGDSRVASLGAPATHTHSSTRARRRGTVRGGTGHGSGHGHGHGHGHTGHGHEPGALHPHAAPTSVSLAGSAVDAAMVAARVTGSGEAGEAPAGDGADKDGVAVAGRSEMRRVVEACFEVREGREAMPRDLAVANEQERQIRGRRRVRVELCLSGKCDVVGEQPLLRSLRTHRTDVRAEVDSIVFELSLSALESFLLDAHSRFARSGLARLKRASEAKESFRLHRLFLAINHPNVDVEITKAVMRVSDVPCALCGRTGHIPGDTKCPRSVIPDAVIDTSADAGPSPRAAADVPGSPEARERAAMQAAKARASAALDRIRDRRQRGSLRPSDDVAMVREVLSGPVTPARVGIGGANRMQQASIVGDGGGVGAGVMTPTASADPSPRHAASMQVLEADGASTVGGVTSPALAGRSPTATLTPVSPAPTVLDPGSGTLTSTLSRPGSRSNMSSRASLSHSASGFGSRPGSTTSSRPTRSRRGTRVSIRRRQEELCRSGAIGPQPPPLTPAEQARLHEQVHARLMQVVASPPGSPRDVSQQPAESDGSRSSAAAAPPVRGSGEPAVSDAADGSVATADPARGGASDAPAAAAGDGTPDSKAPAPRAPHLTPRPVVLVGSGGADSPAKLSTDAGGGSSGSPLTPSSPFPRRPPKQVSPSQPATPEEDSTAAGSGGEARGAASAAAPARLYHPHLPGGGPNSADSDSDGGDSPSRGRTGATPRRSSLGDRAVGVAMKRPATMPIMPARPLHVIDERRPSHTRRPSRSRRLSASSARRLSASRSTGSLFSYATAVGSGSGSHRATPVSVASTTDPYRSHQLALPLLNAASSVHVKRKRLFSAFSMGALTDDLMIKSATKWLADADARRRVAAVQAQRSGGASTPGGIAMLSTSPRAATARSPRASASPRQSRGSSPVHARRPSTQRVGQSPRVRASLGRATSAVDIPSRSASPSKSPRASARRISGGAEPSPPGETKGDETDELVLRHLLTHVMPQRTKALGLWSTALGSFSSFHSAPARASTTQSPMPTSRPDSSFSPVKSSSSQAFASPFHTPGSGTPIRSFPASGYMSPPTLLRELRELRSQRLPSTSEGDEDTGFRPESNRGSPARNVQFVDDLADGHRAAVPRQGTGRQDMRLTGSDHHMGVDTGASTNAARDRGAAANQPVGSAQSNGSSPLRVTVATDPEREGGEHTDADTDAGSRVLRPTPRRADVSLDFNRPDGGDGDQAGGSAPGNGLAASSNMPRPPPVRTVLSPRAPVSRREPLRRTGDPLPSTFRTASNAHLHARLTTVTHSTGAGGGDRAGGSGHAAPRDDVFYSDLVTALARVTESGREDTAQSHAPTNRTLLHANAMPPPRLLSPRAKFLKLRTPASLSQHASPAASPRRFRGGSNTSYSAGASPRPLRFAKTGGTAAMADGGSAATSPVLQPPRTAVAPPT